MPVESFPDWIAALLRYLDLPLPSGPVQPAFTFHFDGKPNVYVAGSDGKVDFMSEAGLLPAPYSSDSLLALLELNRCDGADDAVSVTLDRASGSILLWTRQRQAILNAGEAADLMQLVQEKVDLVQQLLEKSDWVPANHNANALARMQRVVAPRDR